MRSNLSRSIFGKKDYTPGSNGSDVGYAFTASEYLLTLHLQYIRPTIYVP